MDLQKCEIPSFWRSPAGIALVVALLVGGFFLVTEHRAHLLGALPFLAVLSCPLMHLFMHHEHHHGGHSSVQPRPESDDAQR